MIASQKKKNKEKNFYDGWHKFWYTNTPRVFWHYLRYEAFIEFITLVRACTYFVIWNLVKSRTCVSDLEFEKNNSGFMNRKSVFIKIYHIHLGGRTFRYCVWQSLRFPFLILSLTKGWLPKKYLLPNLYSQETALKKNWPIVAKLKMLPHATRKEINGDGDR